jgi:hypothetical protein
VKKADAVRLTAAYLLIAFSGRDSAILAPIRSRSKPARRAQRTFRPVVGSISLEAFGRRSEKTGVAALRGREEGSPPLHSAQTGRASSRRALVCGARLMTMQRKGFWPRSVYHGRFSTMTRDEMRLADDTVLPNRSQPKAPWVTAKILVILAGTCATHINQQFMQYH